MLNLAWLHQFQRKMLYLPVRLTTDGTKHVMNRDMVPEGGGTHRGGPYFLEM